MKRTILFLSLLVLLGATAMATEVVRVTNIPSGSAAIDVEVFGRLFDWVEDYINDSGQLDDEIEFEFIVSDSYEAAILAMKYGDVQIARFGPESYTIANEQAGAIPVVREIRVNTGMPHYFGIICTRNDSDVWGLAKCVDWSQYTLGFVSETSTSGYKVPMSVFKQIGILPDDFKEVFYGGSHEGVIIALVNGHIDVACTTYNRYDEALENGIFAQNDLRVIYTSDAIPTSLVTRAPDFDLIPHELLVEAWTSIPEELCREFKVLGFIPTYDRDYDPIRALGE